MSYYQPAWDSEYDSTWEEDGEVQRPKKKKHKSFYKNRAARDLQNYRHGYPDLPPATPNLEFYQNKIPFKPNGEYIDNIHQNWREDYYTLERNHNFIQWLFPLREQGVNSFSTPLTQYEIQLMKNDEQVVMRFLESYKLMLGFYGMVLLDADTGEVARSERNWTERFENLNNHTHNNLRITRILKCLGEMGYEKFQAPLVRFFLEEILCNGNLPRVKTSALDYFMFTVKNKKERQKLVHFAYMNYKPQHEFVWGPVEKLQIYQPHSGEKSFNNDSFSYYSAENNEISENEPNKRNETLSIVRRTMRFISMPFLYFF
ncbi:opioid growth factor receptor-like isoform X2 [Pyxicephalus adspersus]|uniref:opioid growth factor receptor-like isoform X2 n=1 Tax=Pyxicephalus adspersus TaxID=30357 RepID=UPI003B5AD016